MKPNLVLYHSNCYDGFTAAWIAASSLGRNETECIPVQYGDDPPPVAGKHVYIVDFSFPRDVLEQIWQTARSLVVLDHHKTAQEDLEGLSYCTFDMTKSGARLAWEYFFQNMPVPRLVQYVEDRDLWTWELLHSKEINTYIRSFGFSHEKWDHLSAELAYHMDSCVEQGRSLLRQQDNLVALHVNQSWTIRLGDWQVPIVNATCHISEIAGSLATLSPDGIGACFFINSSGEQVVSLRSRKGGPDVSRIARQFGGGGHAAAAGFKLQKGDWL